MKYQTIKKYLRPSRIMGRKSTFTNAFASALAPHDVYNPEIVAVAMRDLGQNPESNLTCIYCGSEAATWDHLFNRVEAGYFSGHGHRIRNLVPSCRTCNEQKGKKSWRVFLDSKNPVDKDLRIKRIEKFLNATDAKPVTLDVMKQIAPDEMRRFAEIKDEVFRLMAEADDLAEVIRNKTHLS